MLDSGKFLPRGISFGPAQITHTCGPINAKAWGQGAELMHLVCPLEAADGLLETGKPRGRAEMPAPYRGR